MKQLFTECARDVAELEKARTHPTFFSGEPTRFSLEMFLQGGDEPDAAGCSTKHRIDRIVDWG